MEGMRLKHVIIKYIRHIKFAIAMLSLASFSLIFPIAIMSPDMKQGHWFLIILSLIIVLSNVILAGDNT